MLPARRRLQAIRHWPRRRAPWSAALHQREGRLHSACIHAIALIAKTAGSRQLYQVMDYEVQVAEPCADVGATYLCQHERSGRQRSDACSVTHTALL